MGFPWGLWSRKAAVMDEQSLRGLLLGRTESTTGIAVNWQTALDVSTVLACTRVIAEGLAQTPIRYYRKSAAMTGRRERIIPPIAQVLSLRPNSWQTPFAFLETLAFHLILTGNAFAFINRVGGRVYELIPIEPGRVTVTRNADFSLSYRVTSEAGAYRDMGEREIWHIRGPSWNSWMGLEAVKLAREAIGLAVALEQGHAKLHRNGAKVSGLFSVDGALSKERYEQLREWFLKEVAQDQAYRPLILDNGGKYTPMQMTGVDSQHLETRRHQIEEICRQFRVFPIMVGHAGNTSPTFASTEQFLIAHVVHTITPWATRLEQSMEAALLTADDDVDIRFYLRGLQRGAASDRANYAAKALGAGGSPAWATVTEIRDDEDLDWIEGGDELPKPTNVGGGATPSAGT